MYYVRAAGYSPESTLNELAARDRYHAHRIKIFIARPFDAADEAAAKILYYSTQARYDAYIQGQGQFPDELTWFFLEDPRLNSWHFKEACRDDAYYDRKRREKLLLQSCLQDKLAISPIWSKNEVAFAQKVHKWIWKKNITSTEKTYLQTQHMIENHVLSVDIKDNHTYTWCQMCSKLVAKIVEHRLERRKSMIEEVIDFTR